MTLKRIIYFLPITALLIGLTGIYCGCKKQSSGLTFNMRSTINNRPFYGSNCNSILLSGNSLFINGGDFPDTPAPAVFPQITLILTTSNILPGTYVIDGTRNKCQLDSSPFLQLSTSYGTVNITSADPDIVGEFEFTCTDSTKVTAGSFVSKHY